MKKSKKLAEPAKDHSLKQDSSSERHRENGSETRIGSGESSHPEAITSDLILHAMMHVQSWPNHNLHDEREAFCYCYNALKGWKEKLDDLSPSTRIRLSAVLEYALLLRQDKKYSELSLEEAGNIVLATNVSASDRLQQQLDAEKRASEVRRILSSEDCISVDQAAKDVTGDKNATRAVRDLKTALIRLREDYYPIRSEPEIGKFVQLLSDALMAFTKAEKKRRMLPRELVERFTPLLRSFLEQRTSNARRIAAKKSHQNRKTPKQDL